MWTWAELLVNITRLLCLTAVVVAAATAVGVVGWGDDPSETTFRISQSLFFFFSQMGWFATVVRLDYFLTIRLYSGSNFLHLSLFSSLTLHN